MKISNELKVGVYAIIVLVLFFMGFRFLKGVDFFSSSKHYYAVYSNIDGLNRSNPVILNGYSVGRVDDISIMPGTRGKQLVVEIAVDGDITLGDSAKAILANKDFLGSKAIILQVGTITGTPLKEGDTLISEFDRGLTDMLVENVTPVASDISTTIRKVNTILDGLISQQGKIDSTMTNVQSASARADMLIARNQQEISSLIKNVDGLITELRGTNSELKPVIGKFSGFADSLNNLQLQEVVTSSKSLMDRLNNISRNLEEGQGTAGKLLNNDSLYRNLDQAVRDLDSLLVDVNENPKKYVQFSIFGGKNK